MNVSLEGRELIESFEGLRLSAYLDSVGVLTIGYGTTHYPNGQPVHAQDTCTQSDADGYLDHDLQHVTAGVTSGLTTGVNQPQFDALCSFAYNLGVAAFHTSHLRVRVNSNPSDPAIRDEFMKWHLAGGKPLAGLWRRRHDEADFYFEVNTPCPVMPTG